MEAMIREILSYCQDYLDGLITGGHCTRVIFQILVESPTNWITCE